MTRSVKQRAYDYGLWAETRCICYLMLRGWRIVARRHRTPFGEIDLIAQRGKHVLFIEVKARQLRDDGLYALSPQQCARIARAASSYVAAHPKIAGLGMRFDLMVVAKGWRLTHIPHAFESIA